MQVARGVEFETRGRRCAAGWRAAVMLAVLGWAGAGVTVAQRAAPENGASSALVLNGVTIVDTHTGKLTAGMAIVMEGGKITRIGRAGTLAKPAGAVSIDAHGKFVVPGFWDMHMHVMDNPGREDSFALMLANGITGFRQMSGSDALLAQHKEGGLGLSQSGPELLAMPGTILTRANAGTPEAAVGEVQKQKAEGADFIKSIDVSPPAFFASLAEAKRQGLPYLGHLSAGVDAVKASEAGMRDIEHLGPMETVLISCSSAEPAIRRAMAQRPATPPAPVSPEQMARMMQVAPADPVLSRISSDPDAAAKIERVLDTYDEAKCRNLAQVFLKNQTWQVPTLIRLRTMELADDPAYTANPELRYIAAAKQQFWAVIGQQFAAKMTTADKETMNKLLAMQLKVTKMFDAAGVKMLAGSDSGGSGVWVVPGFSLHQEFDLLAQAGLSSLRVLQMTTLNGAEFLGREATDGSVEEGKNANLVLLDGNPVAGVENLHKVSAVVRGGRYYGHDALDGMKTKVQQDVDATKASTPAAARP